MKRSGERERYTQLNAEFQRIARRYKRDFLNEQCKEIEENSSIGKTRDLFKKIGVIKGTCHSRMGTIKHRNCKDLMEADKNKKRWPEYTEELYKKKALMTWITMSEVTYLEPDILEWVLGSIPKNKASGGDGIPVELFNILRDDGVKVLHSICQQIWKTQQRLQGYKRSVFVPIPKRAMPKNVQSTIQLHSLHILARLCSKSFKLGFSST